MKGKKNEIFLSKSICFAIEIVRACLRHTPTDVRLDGLWMQTNIATDVLGDEHSGQRLVSLAILICPGISLTANCEVYCTDGEWKSGGVEMFLNPTQSWRFRCQLGADGRLDVRPVAVVTTIVRDRHGNERHVPTTQWRDGKWEWSLTHLQD